MQCGVNFNMYLAGNFYFKFWNAGFFVGKYKYGLKEVLFKCHLTGIQVLSSLCVNYNILHYIQTLHSALLKRY